RADSGPGASDPAAPVAAGDSLDPSGPAEADRDLVAVHDDGDLPLPLRVRQHAVEVGRAFLHVQILERHLAHGEILTGRQGVGSRVLAENKYHETIPYP